MNTEFAARVVRWQQDFGRHDLPWQNTRDPYRVWISEVMLQQTQVVTVQDYFPRFLARFPDVQALAAAPLDEVLALWSGLGYYSRARNLHRCAQTLVRQHGGVFPRSVAELQALPGIGRSTAGAVASLCFGVRVAILDANVRRVLTRVLGYAHDLDRALHLRGLWDHAEALLPRSDLDHTMPHYSQGLMDIGAVLCLPRRPRCPDCPVQAFCAAHAQGDWLRYPVRTRKLVRASKNWWMLIAHKADASVWLQRRDDASGIWAGLYSPPLFDSLEELVSALPQGLRPALYQGEAFTHTLTHRDLCLHPVYLCCNRGLQRHVAGAWTRAQDWPTLGLPAPVRSLLLKGLPLAGRSAMRPAQA